MSAPPVKSPPGNAGVGRWGWLVMSLASNALLAAFLLGRMGTAISPQQGSNVQSSKVAADSSAGATVRRRTRAIAAATTPGTPWSYLESTNLLDYAANLRRAGCPDETICDVLGPAIKRVSTARKEYARHAADFWVAGVQRRKVNETITATHAAVEAEERRLMESLGCPLHESKNFSEDLLIELVAGFAGPEIRDRVAGLIVEADRRVARWQERTQGILLPEELEAIRRDREEVRQRLAAVMTPAQIEEFELRAFYFQNYLFGGGERVKDLQLTAAEFREFCRLQMAEKPDQAGLLSDFGSMLDDRPRREPEPDSDRALRSVLGDARYEAYVRNADSSYRDATRLVEEFKQPPEVLDQAYALMSEWRSEVPALHERWAEDREGTRRALLERRAAYRQRLEQLFAGLPEDRRRSLVENWTDLVVHEKWRSP